MSVLEQLNGLATPDEGIGLVDMGLIRDATPGRVVYTLPSPACPHGATIAAMLADTLPRAELLLTWTPAWSPQDMTDDGRAQLAALGYTGW